MSAFAGPNTVRDSLILCMDGADGSSYSANVHPAPLDPFVWAGPYGAYQATLSRDPTTSPSPAGGIPLLMATANPGTSAYIGTYNAPANNIAPAIAGETWTMSFWVKGSSAFTASMMIFEANAAGAYISLGQGYYSVTTSWSRVSYTYTFAQATAAYLQARIDCYNTSVNMWIDGIQIERNSAASNFNPVANTNGTTWTDLSRTVNGTLVGTTATVFSSDGGGCLDFSANAGTNSSTARSGWSWVHPIPTTGSFTFNCWVKSVPTSVGQQAFFSNTADANGFRFGIGTDGVYYLIGPNYTEGALSFSGTFVNTQWNNVCVVFDRAGTYNSGAAQMRGYLNGTLFNSATLPASQTAWNTAGYTTAYMAKWPGPTFSSYSGKVGKFEVYSKALSTTEITQNFNAIRGRFGI